MKDLKSKIKLWLRQLGGRKRKVNYKSRRGS